MSVKNRLFKTKTLLCQFVETTYSLSVLNYKFSSML